ncbi:hypothetical protein HUW51_00845 (plasmid) [Adhaeribacter swui]|uniref:Uncharacterized protein n=1 Tax=Adhaeribacter swui TaxID=2086471 RepID=A0A7G7G2F2_9BACT|nr:hypothetical protein [Adhaeribacter swui]QNF31336.1 hypothetical protein HUW51_00845 [Adhaeribacter swui]
MCQAKNKYITPLAYGNNDIIIPDGFVKNYNASPLLDVVLSDFNRPQEFAELLKHHLKSDKKRQKKLRK